MSLATFADKFDREDKHVQPEMGIRTWLSTGFAPLDHAISGRYFGGGMPVGRIVEIFGPSSCGKTAIATKVMAAAQEAGGFAMFMDHERSFDPVLGRQLGLNTDRGPFFHELPETFEESVTYAIRMAKRAREEAIIPAAAPIVIVFDSLAAMVPKSKFAKEIDEQGMNDSLALAKATSAVFPVLALYAEKYQILILVLNQMRLKPGVCLRGDVMIPFVDGTSMMIRDVVKNKISKEVWSFNETTGEFEAKPVSQWHDNGEVSSYEDWTHIRATGANTRNGVAAMTVTNDHLIMTKRVGWTKASDVVIGDKLLTTVKESVNGTLAEFFAATMFGDSSVKRQSANRNTAQVVFQDNNDPDYVAWKVKKLAPFMNFVEAKVKWPGGNGIRYGSSFSHELIKWERLNRNPLKLIAAGFLTPMALALWIMDDAYLSESRRYSLSIKRIKDKNELNDIADALFAMGYRSRVRERDGELLFDAESTKKLSSAIAKYVPDCMSRKLLPEDHGKFVDFELETFSRQVNHWETVTSVGKPGKTMGGKAKRARFDIGVEGNHNYLAGNANGGFLVHNCYGPPETTPGGEAPRYYASVRIQLGAKRLTEGEGDDKEMVGQEINAKIIKNKVSRPFQTAKWGFRFRPDGSGYFDVVGSTLDFLIAEKLIPSAGARVTWTDGKSYFRKALVTYIVENSLQGELTKLLPK